MSALVVDELRGATANRCALYNFEGSPESYFHPGRSPGSINRRRKMATARHYSPRISRFLVSVLYHEAQRRRVPMTQLTDELIRNQLVGGESWEKAEEFRIQEESPPYHVRET